IGVPLIKFPRRHRQQNYAIISGNTNKNFLILRGTELVFISSPLTEHYTLKIRSLLANQRNDTLTVFVQIKSTALQPTNGHHQVSPFKSKIF
ncbi:hypothetical protein, partial [Enterococcus faecalis]|uniref:hypothetical protein n=1 Tax=Enterococcus faecalis TaxID=1351 RepID=UPI00403FAF62